MKKYKSRLLIATLLCCFYNTSFAQQKVSISGTVKEKSSGEILIGATVYILELPDLSVITNSYGFYSLSVPQGNYTIIVSAIGYKKDTANLLLEHNLKHTVALESLETSLEEVVVNTGNTSENVAKPLMGVQKLSIAEIKNVPVIFGEKDVLKTMQLLPGVKSAGDGNSGFYVRGGSADQNLILLDEAPVYNASHLLGFFSAFNSDAIKDLTLYKGSMPAQYGGRLSSVVDIKMNDGNNQDYHASGGIGLIASRLNIEGPIVKDKGSFIISGRRTYADLFLKLSSNDQTNSSTLNFYDLNAKANYRLDDKNKVYLSGYFGKDNLGLGGNFGINYGNTTGTARWNHIFNNSLFSNTSIIYSNYYYNVQRNSGDNDITIKYKIEDVSLKQDFESYIDNSNKIDFGFNVTHHTMSPGIVDASTTSSFNPVSLQKKYSLENAAYISHALSLSGKIKLDYGLRLSAFMIFGPGDFSTYDSTGSITNTQTYNSGDIVKTYINLEPRIAVSFQVNTNASFKWSYTRNTQNLHLLSNSTSGSPTDLWIPSSLNVKPEIADQLSIGYYQNFRNNTFEFSSEAYFKSMQNQIDYKDGTNLKANENVEADLLFGKGRAYGLELFLKKKTGKLTGWVSYTLSRTERNIDGINDGNWYAAKQDQTHNIAIVGMYQLSKKLTVSANWVYNTGNAVTFPSGKYEINGQTTFYYTERNGYRMPAYHRLDVGATLLGKKKDKWESSWTFSVYNVYGRENAYSIDFQDDPDNPSKTQAVQTSLFRWVPSITYNFKF